jgi:hypothetical protein
MNDFASRASDSVTIGRGGRVSGPWSRNTERLSCVYGPEIAKFATASGGRFAAPVRAEPGK